MTELALCKHCGTERGVHSLIGKCPVLPSGADRYFSPDAAERSRPRTAPAAQPAEPAFDWDLVSFESCEAIRFFPR